MSDVGPISDSDEVRDACAEANEMDSNWMDVHAWFSLSYSAYLCVNRSLLQSMPDEWQLRFYKLMDELADYFPLIREPQYTVHVRGADGRRFIKDPIPHYNRGRTLITPADDYGNPNR